MRVRLRRGWGALLIALGLAASPAHAKPTLPLAFPMVVETPKATTATGVSMENRVAFAQPVRSLKAVTLTEAQTIEYKPTVLDRKFTKGGLRHVTFDAGSIFVVALSEAGELYCAAGSDRTDGWMTFYDVGVCYRDKEGDGVFDERLLVEPTTRARTAYEILPQDEPVWTPVRAPYAAMATADIPPAEFRILYNYVDPPLRGPSMSAQLLVCWPDVLVLPLDAKGSRELCSTPSWSSGRAPLDLKELKPTVGVAQKVAWGPFEAEITSTGKGPADVNVTRFHEPGPGIMYLQGFWRSSGDYRLQYSIFEFRRLVVRPAGGTTQ